MSFLRIWPEGTTKIAASDGLKLTQGGIEAFGMPKKRSSCRALSSSIAQSIVETRVAIELVSTLIACYQVEFGF